MKKKKYLPLYYKWIEQGHIDPILPNNYNGMCGLFDKDELFCLMIPTDEDRKNLISDNKCTAWWPSDMSNRESLSHEGWSNFNPLRQNIVLLMAAMNGEL